ncbi:unnamed protein product, partial [Tuber aestivum]
WKPLWNPHSLTLPLKVPTLVHLQLILQPPPPRRQPPLILCIQRAQELPKPRPRCARGNLNPTPGDPLRSPVLPTLPRPVPKPEHQGVHVLGEYCVDYAVFLQICTFGFCLSGSFVVREAEKF